MHSIQRVATWERLPGNWDVLNFSEVFPSGNKYGIPTLANDAYTPLNLIGWGSRPMLLAVESESNSAIHFFLDDYRFESLWRDPERNVDALLKIGLVLSPDFSLWRDMPLAMQIWQVYRNRWIGCYWQTRGIKVIPTVSWSEPYDFCYFGIPAGSIVAVSPVGIVNDALACKLFRDGFEKMIDVLRPSIILSYGSLKFLGITEAQYPLVEFPTRWQQKRKTRTPQTEWMTLWEYSV